MLVTSSSGHISSVSGIDTLEIYCSTCGDTQVDYGDDIQNPTAHFCCCGVCGWVCNHDHPPYGDWCHTIRVINHSEEFIRPYPGRADA